MSKVRVHVFFRGRVQGVFFRDWTRRKSVENGVAGWVKNLSNGNVEAVFEGERGAVESVIEWLCTSHPNAHVDQTEREDMEYTGELIGFEIKH